MLYMSVRLTSNIHYRIMVCVCVCVLASYSQLCSVNLFMPVDVQSPVNEYIILLLVFKVAAAIVSLAVKR